MLLAKSYSRIENIELLEDQSLQKSLNLKTIETSLPQQ